MLLDYDCSKCPAYCCSYDQIELEDRDLNRLAKHLQLDLQTFMRRYTKSGKDLPVLRHQKDEIFGSVCVFLDKETRRCNVYDARPDVCREYPDRPRCGYWDFLSWEREFQNDEESLPLNRLSWSPASS
jgi:uncharacterized protein